MLHHKREDGSFCMAYHIFGYTAGHHVRKTGTSVSSHSDQISINAFAKIDHSHFFRKIIKYIERIILKSKFFGEFLHGTFYRNVTLKIGWRVYPYQMDCG